MAKHIVSAVQLGGKAFSKSKEECPNLQNMPNKTTMVDSLSTSPKATSSTKRGAESKANSTCFGLSRGKGGLPFPVAATLCIISIQGAFGALGPGCDRSQRRFHVAGFALELKWHAKDPQDAKELSKEILFCMKLVLVVSLWLVCSCKRIRHAKYGL